MGSCNIDHSAHDVMEKLKSQQQFLPGNLYSGVKRELEENNGLDQATLNEIFHLLKKYDLASGEEQQDRNAKLEQYVK